MRCQISRPDRCQRRAVQISKDRADGLHVASLACLAITSVDHDENTSTLLIQARERRGVLGKVTM